MNSSYLNLPHHEYGPLFSNRSMIHLIPLDNNQEVPKWQQMQEHTFTVWLNERLQPQGLVINDLYDDLDDGVMLIQLLNILFNTEVTKYGPLSIVVYILHE